VDPSRHLLRAHKSDHYRSETNIGRFYECGPCVRLECEHFIKSSKGFVITLELDQCIAKTKACLKQIRLELQRFLRAFSSEAETGSREENAPK